MSIAENGTVVKNLLDQISPANHMVVASFCTSDGSNQAEAMSRTIMKKLNNK